MEKKIAEEEEHEEEEKMPPWIAQEFRVKDEVEGLVSDSFQFVLDTEGTFEFKWDPPKNQELVLSATVFRVSDDGNIMLRQEGEEK